MKAVLIIFSIISYSCRCTSVLSRCVTCEHNTPREQCMDPYVPFSSMEEVCDEVDDKLCMRYGDYAIYCNYRGTQYSCMKLGHCGDIVPARCVTCPYGTPKHRCRDQFTPQGSVGDICGKDETNEALCKKYGDYAIYCGWSGSSMSCMRQGQCGPTDAIPYRN